MFNFSITHQTLEFKESTKDYFPLEESIPVNAYFTVRNDCLLNNPYFFLYFRSNHELLSPHPLCINQLNPVRQVLEEMPLPIITLLHQ